MAALPPMPPLRENAAGSVVRTVSSSRLARWQPYFANCHSIPNKRALPSLIRLHQLPISPARSATASNTLPQATLSTTRSRPTDQHRGAPSKPHREDSQLPTPNSSPPGTPPTLLEQTSSNYVLELSLAILASIYFQPGHQQAPHNLAPSGCSEDSVIRAASPTLPTLSTPTLEPSTLPITPTLAPRTVASQKPPKDVTPLTPQSPHPIQPAALPPPPPVFPQEPIHVQSLPSKRELTRHLSALGALEPQPGAAPAGSMRWFLTELFKRAALPGLIIRVAAGYVLRCRAAINRAMQTVALRNQLQLATPSDVSLPLADRTPQERVLTDARRVFLAALVLACKFVFDKPYDNRSWSLISGLGSRDIGECERVVGDVLGWRLWIGAGRAPQEQ
ncbi:unnamed protein product [Rhizoctonia solani]|uniref:Cyclin N-terminal domain-containing protein n=1 Tax=Rhizoctonia solani TaxID=456999 RepID=A0A8H3BX23_9AGAM|nr:unnamed protein product [Rhizoctonia solani]